MREKNIGNHNLESRGYAGKEPIWAKEDAAIIADGKPNPFDKFEDLLAKNFIRSRYRRDPITGEFYTTEKVAELEKHLVRNLPD